MMKDEGQSLDKIGINAGGVVFIAPGAPLKPDQFVVKFSRYNAAAARLVAAGRQPKGDAGKKWSAIVKMRVRGSDTIKSVKTRLAVHNRLEALCGGNAARLRLRCRVVPRRRDARHRPRRGGATTAPR